MWYLIIGLGAGAVGMIVGVLICSAAALTVDQAEAVVRERLVKRYGDGQ